MKPYDFTDNEQYLQLKSFPFRRQFPPQNVIQRLWLWEISLIPSLPCGYTFVIPYLSTHFIADPHFFRLSFLLCFLPMLSVGASGYQLANFFLGFDFVWNVFWQREGEKCSFRF